MNWLKKSVTLFAAATLLLLASGSIWAADTSMRVSVPFGFNAGDSALPAGNYSLSLDRPFNRLVLINNTTGEGYFMMPHIPSNEGKPLDRASLVFHKYGAQYFLHAAKWRSGVTHQWAPSKAESSLLKEQRPAEVAVAAPGN